MIVRVVLSSSLLFRAITVSSAYALIRVGGVLAIERPLREELFIAVIKHSWAITYRRHLRASPCLIPLVIGIGSDRFPFTDTEDVALE